MTGTIQNVEYKGNSMLVTLEINDKQDLKIDGKLQDITIKPHKNKRSKNANAYAWELLGKLQQELAIPKEDIYREYIKKVGAYDVIQLLDKAVDRFRREWKDKGLGWITEIISEIDGYTNVIAYYGTSSYNQKEMATFINQIVFDCEELGIETKPQEEIQSLLESWNGNE